MEEREKVEGIRHNQAFSTDLKLPQIFLAFIARLVEGGTGSW